MSQTIMRGILTILILSCLVTLASGIFCYDCNFGMDDCLDAYKSPDSHLSECDDDSYCVKYKTIVWIRDSGEITGKAKNSSTVTRTCQPKKGEAQGCSAWQNNGGVTFKCWCGTDNCNSGTSLRLAITPVVMGFMTGLIGTVCSLHH